LEEEMTGYEIFKFAVLSELEKEASLRSVLSRASARIYRAVAPKAARDLAVRRAAEAEEALKELELYGEFPIVLDTARMVGEHLKGRIGRAIGTFRASSSPLREHARHDAEFLLGKIRKHHEPRVKDVYERYLKPVEEKVQTARAFDPKNEKLLEQERHLRGLKRELFGTIPAISVRL